MKNAVKHKLAAGQSVRGLFVKTPDPVIAEIIARSGVDYIACDAEHGAAGVRDVENFCRAVDLHGGMPFIRVAAADRATLLRSFDAGCMGVHVPWVDDASIARAAVSHIKYQPLGNRGLAGTRVSNYGQAVDLIAYMAEANRETLICVQIESEKGVRNAAEIAAVEGVDVVFVGPTDLSNSMGIPLQFSHPRLLESIDTVAVAARAAGKVFGIFVRDVSEIAHWERKGARYFISNFEGLVFGALRNYCTASPTVTPQSAINQ